MKEITLNKEYTYKQLCELLGWKNYSGGNGKKSTNQRDRIFI